MINKPLIILAGGFGTRLQSILKGDPKPLADINGVPFIYFLIKNWIEKGFSDFIFSLHFEADKIIDFIEKNKSNLLINCTVRYIVEPSPLGTGGAISYILNNLYIKDDFFIVNADTWVEDGYSTLNNSECNAIGILQIENTDRYGKISIDDNNIIIKFEEKNGLKIKGFINIGVYKFSKSIFPNWDGLPYSLEKDLFPVLVKQKKIKGLLIHTNFIDIGIPEDYYKFTKIKST
jgi:D-glycero-alpha-D-manno-heptose 1-phosphate guanylyltransferase